MEAPRDIIPFASQLSQKQVGFGAAPGQCNTLGTILLGAVITYFAPPIISGFFAGIRDAFDERK